MMRKMSNNTWLTILFFFTANFLFGQCIDSLSVKKENPGYAIDIQSQSKNIDPGITLEISVILLKNVDYRILIEQESNEPVQFEIYEKGIQVEEGENHLPKNEHKILVSNRDEPSGVINIRSDETRKVNIRISSTDGSALKAVCKSILILKKIN